MPHSTEDAFAAEEANLPASPLHTQDSASDMPSEARDDEMPMPGTPQPISCPTVQDEPEPAAPTTAQLNMQHTDWLEVVHTRMDELLTANDAKLTHQLGFETLDSFYFLD